MSILVIESNSRALVIVMYVSLPCLGSSSKQINYLKFKHMQNQLRQNNFALYLKHKNDFDK